MKVSNTPTPAQPEAGQHETQPTVNDRAGEVLSVATIGIILLHARSSGDVHRIDVEALCDSHESLRAQLKRWEDKEAKRGHDCAAMEAERDKALADLSALKARCEELEGKLLLTDSLDLMTCALHPAVRWRGREAPECLVCRALRRADAATARAKVLEEALKKERKLKNELVLKAYPAMDAVDDIRRLCDAQPYSNSALTVHQIRSLLTAPAGQRCMHCSYYGPEDVYKYCGREDCENDKRDFAAPAGAEGEKA